MNWAAFLSGLGVGMVVAGCLIGLVALRCAHQPAAPVDPGRGWDDYDGEVLEKGVLLNEATRRFLKRRTTQKVIAAGILDADVVEDLVTASDRMHQSRIVRLAVARGEIPS